MKILAQLLYIDLDESILSLYSYFFWDREIIDSQLIYHTETINTSIKWYNSKSRTIPFVFLKSYIDDTIDLYFTYLNNTMTHVFIVKRTIQISENVTY